MNLRPLLCLSAFLAAPPGLAQDSASIAVVNAQLAHVAATLTGDAVEIVFPVPPDVDPAHWVPDAEDIEAIQRADLILLNGAGYAGWRSSAVLPRARLVDTTAGLSDRLIPAGPQTPDHRHGPEGEHAHDGAYAFTTWLDPEFARAQVDAAAQAVSDRWPDLTGQVGTGAMMLHREIDAMDAGFSAFFDEIAGRQVFTSHPVYQYLERAYGGDFLSLHWEPDADPGDAEWREFEQALEPERAPILLWEGAPLASTVKRLQELGVAVVIVDPGANAARAEWGFPRLARETGAQ